MEKSALMKIIGIDDIIDLPKRIMEIISGDVCERDKIYKLMLQANKYDLSYDWFQKIYEEDFAQRKQNKQDFTPNELGILCSEIVNSKGVVHEPTAGNGSMLIANWYNNLRKQLVWQFFPSDYMVDCWELSARAIPILLFNLSIRGIMGVVHHGDVLEKQEKCRYLLLNKADDALAFSDVIIDVECSKIIKKV